MILRRLALSGRALALSGRVQVSGHGCRFNSSGGSAQLLPSFTTEGNFDKFQHSLRIDARSRLVLFGQSLVPCVDVDIHEFDEGAQLAAEVVTKEIAEANLGSLREILTPACYAKLTGLTLSAEERTSLVIRQEDVVITWVVNTSWDPDGNHFLTLGIISMPHLGEIKEIIKVNKEKAKHFQEEIKRKIPENIREEVRQFQASLENPATKFHGNEFVISNLRFVRAQNKEDWLLDSIQIRNGKSCLFPLFYIRWKGRMAMATKSGWRFHSFLRYDYATDYVILASLMIYLIFRDLAIREGRAAKNQSNSSSPQSLYESQASSSSTSYDNQNRG